MQKKYGIIWDEVTIVWNEDASARSLQKHRLREDAAYIGILLLAVEGFSFYLGDLLHSFASVVSISEMWYLACYALVYTMMFVIPAVLVSVFAGHRYFPLSPAKRVNALDAFFGVLVAIGGCMLANVIASYVAAFLELLGAERPAMPAFLQPNLPSLLMNLLVFAVLPALVEELVFRGYVLRVFRAYGDWFAVLVSSLLFGFMHGNIEQIPFAIVVGFLLGWLYVMTDNIWLPVAVHFGNNAFATLLDYASIGMKDTQHTVFFTVTVLLLLVLGLVSFGVLLSQRSALLRRLPRRGSLGLGARFGALFSSVPFLLCLAVYLYITIARS